MYITATIIACIALLLIAFFVGIQTAFIHASRLNIELKKKQGRIAGAIIDHFTDQPSKFIGSCIAGIVIFLVLYTLCFSTAILPFWQWVPIHSPYIILSIDIILSTTISILLGYWLPKIIAKVKADNFLLHSIIANIAQFFSTLFTPLITLTTSISMWVLDIVFNMPVKQKKEAFIATNPENFLDQSKEAANDTQDLNEELFENALSLPNVKIRQCLVPRKEIEAISIQTPISQVKQKFIETRLSKLIVFDNTIDNIVGYIHQLDLFKNPENVQAILYTIPAVPESMSAIDLISKFSTSHKSIAWVVDEFGGTAGVVSMEDILEEIFGEIEDEYDTEERIEKKIGDQEFLFSGRLELDYLQDRYQLTFAEPDSETLSGYIINRHESIPKQKEYIIIENYAFEILAVSDTRIETVKLKILK